ASLASVIFDPLRIRDAVSRTRAASVTLDIWLRDNCRQSRADIRNFLLPLRHPALASQMKTRSKLGLHHLPITAPAALAAAASRDDPSQRVSALSPSKIVALSV